MDKIKRTGSGDMKIQSIYIKGMHNIDELRLKVGNFAYLFGNNGVGKSTVMQAIQLALLGHIPGTDKTKSAIFKHANGADMVVRLQFDDGTAIERTWKQVGKDLAVTASCSPADLETSRFESLLGGVTIPVVSFAEFTGMTANKLKEWFINFLPAADTSISWDVILKKELKTFSMILDEVYVFDLINRAKKHANHGVASVKVVNEMFKAELAAKTAEQKQLQGAVQSLVFYDDIVVTDSPEQVQALIDGFNYRIQVLLVNLAVIKDAKTAVDAFGALELVADSIEQDPMYIASNQTLLENSQRASDLDMRSQDFRNQIAVLTSQIDADTKIVQGNGVCPYTDKHCDDISSRLRPIGDKIATQKELVADLTAKLNLFSRQLHDIKTQNASANQEITNILNKYQKAADLRNKIPKTLPEGSIEDMEKEIEQLRNSIKTAEDYLVKLRANEQYEALIQKFTADKYRVEQQISILKAWIKLTDANGMQSSMMDAPFLALEAVLTKNLQRLFGDVDIAASFLLINKANSFEFGLLRGLVHIPYDLLSSGEKCLYALGMLISLIQINGPELPLVLVDDLLDHLDTFYAQHMFDTVYHTEGIQFIFAGTEICLHDHSDEFVIKMSNA